MAPESDFTTYFDRVSQAGLIDWEASSSLGSLIESINSKPDRVHSRLKLLFHNINFESKTVLDIGAGSGLYAAYAAHSGADRVVALEPEVEGSSTAMFNKLRRISDYYTCIDPKPVIFQNYNNNEEFDVIISLNSINHLDEEACIRLRDSQDARKTYHEIFSSLAGMAAPGSDLVVSDAARRNLWHDMGLTNPSARQIEWEKHQSPTLWSNLLSSHGFVEQGVLWLSSISAIGASVLGSVGTALCSNRPVSYLTSNNFVLRMHKK